MNSFPGCLNGILNKKPVQQGLQRVHFFVFPGRIAVTFPGNGMRREMR